MLIINLLILFPIFISSKTIINVDFGTQYIKFGQVDTSESSMHIRKVYNKFIIPGLITIKVPKGTKLPLTKEIIEKMPTKSSSTSFRSSSKNTDIIHFITGWKGTSLLHREPGSGTEFILNAITRGKDNSCQIFDPPILLNTFFENILNDLENKADDFGKFSLTFPTFFTPAMRNLIREPLSNIPNISIVYEFDTLTALATLYSNYYIYRYHDSQYGRNVLFIDVGSEYVETLFVNFKWAGSRTVANCLVNLWSDKCGTQEYINQMHIKFKVPFTHAEKLLRETSDYSIFQDPDYVTPFTTLINKTISLAKQPIDEVQLIGGGSSYNFIRNLVTSAVNDSYRDNVTVYDSQRSSLYISMEQQRRFRGADKKVYPLDIPKLINSLRDTQNVDSPPEVMTEINPFEGITRGAMFAILYNENNPETNKNPITIKKEKPCGNYYIKLASQKVIYCENQKWCQSMPTIDHCIGDDNNIVEIVAENRENELGGIPQGAPIVANRYKLRDLKTFVQRIARENKLDLNEESAWNDFSGRFHMKMPDPIISKVEWCYKDECQPLSIEEIHSQTLNGSKEIDYSMFKILHYRITEAKEREVFSKKTKKALDRIRSIVHSSGNRNIKATNSQTKKYEEYRQMFDNGTFDRMPLDEINGEIVPKMRELCRAFGFRYN